MANFKNTSRSAEEETTGNFCGNTNIGEEEVTLELSEEEKEIFKTAGGKYIAPQTLENKFKESPYIEQMIVIGGHG